jgi:hypothetical protein
MAMTDRTKVDRSLLFVIGYLDVCYHGLSPNNQSLITNNKQIQPRTKDR